MLTNIYIENVAVIEKASIDFDEAFNILTGETKLSQVYRNFLLTETVRLYEHLDDSLSIVIAPKDNTSNKEDEVLLSKALKEDYKYKFQVIDLESFIDALMNGFPNEPIFQKFWHRYLDFRPVELIQSKLGL